jgi:hypothetical protein
VYIEGHYYALGHKQVLKFVLTRIVGLAVVIAKQAGITLEFGECKIAPGVVTWSLQVLGSSHLSTFEQRTQNCGKQT